MGKRLAWMDASKKYFGKWTGSLPFIRGWCVCIAAGHEICFTGAQLRAAVCTSAVSTSVCVRSGRLLPVFQGYNYVNHLSRIDFLPQF